MTGIYLLSVMRKEVASIVTMQMGTGCVSYGILCHAADIQAHFYLSRHIP